MYIHIQLAVCPHTHHFRTLRELHSCRDLTHHYTHRFAHHLNQDPCSFQTAIQTSIMSAVTSSFTFLNGKAEPLKHVSAVQSWLLQLVRKMDRKKGGRKIVGNLPEVSSCTWSYICQPEFLICLDTYKLLWTAIVPILVTAFLGRRVYWAIMMTSLGPIFGRYVCNTDPIRLQFGLIMVEIGPKIGCLFGY